MMKSIFFGIVALMFAAVVMNQEQASVLAEGSTSGSAGGPDITKWKKMDDSCTIKLHEQIKKEFDASIFYLQYAAYFANYKVNLPGFEKFFFDAASEERQHGMKLIEYALMRGQNPIDYNRFSLDFTNAAKKLETEPSTKTSTPALKALEQALEREQIVTSSIRDVIKACENETNDYHLVDYLTGEFLEEQHQGQRDLAGKIAMLKKMLKTNPHLGDFIFDKQNM